MQIGKYEYLTGEEVRSPDKKRVIEQANFTYSPLGKAFEKQIKTIEDQGVKQIKVLRDHGKQLIESNEVIKKDFNIDKDSIPLEK